MRLKRPRNILAATLMALWLLTLFRPYSQSTILNASPQGSNLVFLPLISNPVLQTVFGIEMQSITSTAGLAQMAAAQTSWVRRNAVLWSDIESSQSTYDWDANKGLESELINAAQNGLQPILVVRSTPAWAQAVPGMFCGPIAQDSLAAFGAFMHALVARYSIPPYNVKYWEIWNEPDVDPSFFPDNPKTVYGCWGDHNDPYYGGGYYARMLQTVYPQIKAADGNAQVLLGGLLLDCDPGSPCGAQASNIQRSKFLEGILQAGGGPDFDGVSFHAYDYYGGALGRFVSPNWSSAWNSTGPAMIAKSKFIRTLLSSYGASGKFLMSTETALLCDSCTNDPVFEQTKAYYLVQQYAAALAYGVQADVWFSALGWRNSGLLAPDLTPLPAYTAYAFARAEIRNAAFVRNITTYPNVAGYVFNRGGHELWLLWSLDGSSHSLALPAVPSKAWDALGASVAPASSMTVDLKPIYLEWP